MWHILYEGDDSFTYVSWCIYMCDTAHSHVWQDLVTRMRSWHMSLSSHECDWVLSHTSALAADLPAASVPAAALYDVAPPTVALRRSRWDVQPDNGTATDFVPNAAPPNAAFPTIAPCVGVGKAALCCCSSQCASLCWCSSQCGSSCWCSYTIVRWAAPTRRRQSRRRRAPATSVRQPGSGMQ